MTVILEYKDFAFESTTFGALIQLHFAFLKLDHVQYESSQIWHKGHVSINTIWAAHKEMWKIVIYSLCQQTWLATELFEKLEVIFHYFFYLLNQLIS